MKKTIKYLDNDGNYQYATVKDAGDLDKLKTKAKEDLVSAINELATNGITASDIDEINNKVDQIQQQANQNADALNMSDQERQEMQQQIAQMQAEAQAKIAEMQKLAEEQNKKLQEASAELKKKADAIDVQKMQQDNAEALKNSAKALEDSLAATNEDLQKTADHLNEMEIQAGVVETSVKELQNGFESKVSSADFNEARTKLQEQETMVRQLNNELSTKASNNELDMVTQRVQKAESDIQQNAQGIKASVTKETMYKEMDDFAKYRENRLKYSRDFSNDWSLNGNDIIDDDHLFDTQHDVKSVSIRNGAYLTQTTDLDTDDMSKTFTLSMWVEKGKKPLAWYGSAELTNMKVKEDKGDYQRVYWTFAPTIVKQVIWITGDTSTQGNLIISEPKLEQSDRPSAWSTNTGDQYATTEKLAHDLKLTADKLESTITKQSEFSDRQLQDESRIAQTEHGLEVANKTIVSKTDGLRQEFDGKIDATSKSLTTEYQSFTNRALGQMADGGANLILNSSFGSLKNSFDKWTNVNPKARIVTDDNGLKWVKLEQSGLTADSPIGLTSNLFRVQKGVVTIGLDIRTDNAGSIDNDNIVILESYNAEQKRVFTKDLGFGDFKITRETLFDHGSHRVTYKYNQTRDDTQYMAVHILLPKNGILYATNVLARTIANGEDSGEYAPNDADLREQVVQQRTRIEQNDQAIALKADQTKVTQDIDAAKSSLSGAISKVEQRAANLEVKADGITSSVSTLSKTIDGISVGGTNLMQNTTKDYVKFTGNGWGVSFMTPNNQPIDVSVEGGETYTFSAWVKNDSSSAGRVDLEIYQYNAKGENKLNGSSSEFSVWASPGEEKRLVFTKTLLADTTRVRFHTRNRDNNGTVTYWTKMAKVEKGTIPTDWSPAPEDTDSNISSLQSRTSKLEQTDSEIKASVTSVTNDLKNGRGSIKEGILSMTDDHFSTKFSSIDNKIDGISVGGTNYMSHDLISGVNSTLSYDANSGEWTAQIANGAGGTWGAGVQFNKSLMQVPWDHAYTDSIEVYVTDPGLEWMMDINNFGVVNDSNLGGNDNDDRSLAIYRPAPNTRIPTNQWYKVSFTAWNKASKNKNQTALWDQSKLLLVNNTGKTVTVKFRHPQQELGSTATDWTPASGDATSSGINILRNTTYPGGFVTFPAEWTAGQWRQASNGGSKKERWDYNGSPIGNVKGYRVESGSESRDVTVAQDNVVISANTEYTMSVFARGSGQLFMQMGFEQTWISNSQTLSAGWTRYKFTFNSYGLTKANAYFGLKSANSWVDLIGFKLEQGNVATAWTPSPWDAQARIDGVVSKQAEFQTSIDGVKSTVSTLNNNQAKFTKFEQTDGGFKLVAGQQTLEFGGTNLLKNSDFQQGWTNWSSHGSSSAISDSRPSGLPNYVKTIDFLSNTGSSQSALVQSHIGVKAGKDYMVSFWAKADAPTELWVESNAIRYQPKLTTSWQYYSGKVTFQTDDRPLYIYPTSKTTWVHLAGIKLEQGNVATAWSPELVDKTTNLQTQITAANQALDSKVGKEEVFSAIKQTPDAIILTANDIELKSKTALKVGKITGKDLSIDLSNGAVDFKHGHIRGNLIDIDIDSNTIEGGTIKGAWIQAGTLASVTSQNTVTRSPIRDRYNLQPVGVDKTHVIDRHGTMVNGNNMWEIHAGDNISTDTETHAFFSLVADYGLKHPITSELNVERASPNGFEFLNTRSVYRFTTIQNRTRDYWTLVPIGTVLNVSAGAWDELILRYRLSIKNGGTKSDKIPLQLVFWPTTQTNGFTWNSDNNQLSYLQLGEINLNDGELPSYKFSELRHYASGSLAEYTDTLTLSKFGWDSIPSMGMAIALKFSGEATIDFDPIAFSITNSGNIATERGGSQNTYIDPLGNIDNVYANNKYNKILSLSQGGLKLSASDIDTKTSASVGDFILSMDGRTLSFTAHPDFARGPRIVFGGDGNDDGITMSSYGNIDGMTGSWAWKVRDSADRLRLQLPLAENKTGNDGAWMRFRDLTMDIEGAENKLKFTWWSNSGFYGGVKVPCLATDNVFSGQGKDGSGIAFANGQYVYFTRNKWRSVGI